MSCQLTYLLYVARIIFQENTAGLLKAQWKNLQEGKAYPAIWQELNRDLEAAHSGSYLTFHLISLGWKRKDKQKNIPKP